MIDPCLSRLSGRADLATRLPRTNTYTLTADGLKAAVFYTKLDRRLLRPLLAADQWPALPLLRAALVTIDRAITDYVKRRPARPRRLKLASSVKLLIPEEP